VEEAEGGRGHVREERRNESSKKEEEVRKALSEL